MTSLEITHSDGTTDDIDETLGWSRQREIGGMRRVVIDVERGKASGANLDAKEDNIDLGSIDTVRLVDIDSGSSSWRLTCYSAEWLANTVPPTAGGNLREGTDNALVTGLIGDVPAWTAGTVDTLTSGLSFVHNHAHIHEALRRVERNVPGEIQFRDFGVVDYLDSLGSDKTGSVTLSAANANIESEIRITNRGRELDGTHIRVLGAHEGEAQYFANLVPSTDPASYDNRVDYTTSRWSSGDTKDWDVWSNKDVTDQDTIEEEAAAIGAEIESEYVEAKTTVPNSVGLEVGDWVHVEKPDADLDRDMRVHRITTRAGSMNDTDSAAAVVDEVLLSTRTTMRQDDSDVLADVKRFTSGYQGASVWGTVGPVEQNVANGEPLTIPFFYPDIEYENKVEVYVDSREFRYYVDPATHNHTVDVTHPSHSHTIDESTFDHTHSVNVTHPSHTHDVTHPSHTHDVTHPSHTHDVTHPSHSHSVSDTSTSTANAYNASFSTTSASLSGSTPTTDTEDLSDGGNGDVFVFVDGMVSSQSGSNPVGVNVNVHDGTSANDQIGNGNATTEIGDRFAVGVYVRREDRSSSSITIEVVAQDGQLPATDMDIEKTDADITSVPQHTHDVSISATSSTELGTTETSTTALGSTETSTAALGSTETSTAALGTTNAETAASTTDAVTTTSETALGTTSSETSTNEAGVDTGVSTSGETVTDADLKVNGSTVSSSIGSGSFQTTIDISGTLNKGQWNTIEVDPSGTGRFIASVAILGYRQIGAN